MSGCLGIALCIGIPLQATIAADAGAFVQTLGSQAMKVLNDAALSPAERSRDLRQLLTENFDLERIGRLALGRFDKQASEVQRQEYRALFADFIVMTYSARIGGQVWNTFTVVDTRETEGGDIIVGTESTANGQVPSHIEWRVHEADAGFRIVDVAISGISMVLTQRDEFAAVIQTNNGGIAALLQRLQQKTSSLR